MNITRFLTREDPITGLSISDASIRLMLLERIGGSKKIAIKAIAEEGLPEGAIIAGEIKDEKIVIATLKTILGRINSRNVKYIILSLPMDKIYSKIFRFPSSLRAEQLDEAVRTSLGFNIPLDINNVYLDWERIDTERPINEICLTVIPKEMVDKYMDTLGKIGLKIVAVESHALSMMRSLKINTEKPTLIATRSGAAPTIFITENRAVKFTHVLAQDLSENYIEGEIKKISYYYESKDQPIENVISYKGLEIADKFANHELIEPGHHHKWASTVGAALRGLMPRSEDNLISLLPVGTEKAYEYQKAIAFIEFISNSIIGISIFFLAAFAGGLLTLNYLQASYADRISVNAPPPNDAVEIEQKALQFNSVVRGGLSTINKIPKWSGFLIALREQISSGITISRIVIPQEGVSITLEGEAKDRSSLNDFRKILDEWDLITNIGFPLANLEQRENIPFTATFDIKDKNTINR